MSRGFRAGESRAKADAWVERDPYTGRARAYPFVNGPKSAEFDEWFTKTIRNNEDIESGRWQLQTYPDKDDPGFNSPVNEDADLAWTKYVGGEEKVKLFWEAARERAFLEGPNADKDRMRAINRLLERKIPDNLRRGLQRAGKNEIETDKNPNDFLKSAASGFSLKKDAKELNNTEVKAKWNWDGDHEATGKVSLLEKPSVTVKDGEIKIEYGSVSFKGDGSQFGKDTTIPVSITLKLDARGVRNDYERALSEKAWKYAEKMGISRSEFEKSSYFQNLSKETQSSKALDKTIVETSSSGQPTVRFTNWSVPLSEEIVGAGSYRYGDGRQQKAYGLDDFIKTASQKDFVEKLIAGSVNQYKAPLYREQEEEERRYRD